MVRPTRRSFLGSGVGLVGLLAGCAALSPESSGDPSGGSTRTTTGSRSRSTSTADGGPNTTDRATPAWRVSNLSADAAVVQQPTDDRPPTVELGVTNDHDRSVTLVPDSSDAMLYYLPPMEGETVDVVLVPEDVSSPVIPDARIDGCWRLNADSRSEAGSEVIQLRPSQIAHELGPGERYAIRHEVYHVIGSGACYPDGEYTTGKTLLFTEKPGKRAVAIQEEEAGPAFRLEYTLTTEADGSIAIDVEGPDPA